MDENLLPTFLVATDLALPGRGGTPEIRLLIHLVEQAAAAPCEAKRSDDGTLMLLVGAEDEQEARADVMAGLRAMNMSDTRIESVEPQP